MSFTEKLKVYEILVTEIMGLPSQIPKPTKPYAGEAVYSSQQEERVCVQHISHPVQWCSRKYHRLYGNIR